MIDQKSVRRVLRDWHSLKALGENPLVRLDSVQARHQAANYAESPVGFGLALREVVQAAMENLRPEPDAPNAQEKRWRPYIILTEQYLHGRSPEWIQEQLHISKGTYYGEQERALEMLASLLFEETSASHGTGGLSPNSDEDRGKRARAPYLAPGRTSHPFVDRKVIYQELRDCLLNQDHPVNVALEGLPGVGKTALAVELAHDPKILERYPDGILWAGLGRQPDLPTLLGAWAAAVGISAETLASQPDLLDRSALIRAAIGSRRMLLVIDDAWQMEAAFAFKVGGTNCAHLMTTRLVDLALDFAEGRVLVVHELDPEDGMELLRQISPQVVQSNPDEARRLVDLVGGLPLALILIGRYLQKQSFNPQRRRLRQALENLQAVEARLQVSQPQASPGLHPGVPASLSLSLQVVIGISDAALEDVAHRALLDLSIFPPKPNSFSEEAALYVADADPRVLDTLVDRGLLECVAPDRYTLHQTVADYAACSIYAPYVIYTAPTKGACSAAKDRYISYFVHYAENQASDFASLEMEIPNLLGAIQVAFITNQNQEAARLAKTLAPYLEARGLEPVYHDILQKAQAAADTRSPESLTATLYLLRNIEVRRGGS